jgi:sugar phosphate isomerase/epimerase
MGIQLYTLRGQILKDVRGVIAAVAKAGYNDTETYDYNLKNKFFGLAPQEFSNLLKDNGLTSTSGHYGMEQLITKGSFEDLKTYIEAAKIVGQDYIVLPHLAAPLRSTSDQYKAIADKVNKAAELCEASGIHFGYHNHDFEFQKLADGGVGYEILLKNTDPLVKFELDLYWAVRAGRNPLTLFRENPGRFVMWHVKDMSKNDPKVQTEVGKGSINFQEIFAQAKLAGTKRFFVEHENNYVPDPLRSIVTSAAYVKSSLM